MNDSKRILVIGGAGLIGSHLCRALVDRNYEVHCMDIRSYESSPILREIISQPNFNFIRHNVVNQFGIDVDEIYNLATPSTLRYEQGAEVETLKVNIIGTLNCLEVARHHRSRMLFASSGDVYGSIRQQSMQEDTTFGPVRSALSEGKRAAESLVRAYRSEYQVDGKITRIFNTYGTGADTSDQRVVAKMIVKALTGQNITIYGNGEQLRTFCWVGDVVDALIRLMNRLPDVEVPTVNIGSNHE
ncbi:MAG: NAD-dependent epimerase/dehydratase family protein, partial [Rikenellaceae bacterium]|nr:NAD-dependent epimerase/dehydratase family protein [Rikenellaceae bacterium]